jgi:aminopeptidase N
LQPIFSNKLNKKTTNRFKQTVIMKNVIILGFAILGFQSLSAQFTRKDSLQGGLRPERTCYDVMHYDLNIKINPEEKSISGYNDIAFKIVNSTKKIQIDLFKNMQVDSIVFNSKKISFKREFNAVFLDFPMLLTSKSQQTVRFYYSGKPIVAKRAPWDGGFVFTNDAQGKPWIGVACQGTGASLWYPVKDSQSDEPDFGATLRIAVPKGLTAVANGRLVGSEDIENNYSRWEWEVKNPINTYDINVTIADFVHFHDNYKGLDLDYYVLRDSEERARKQFEGVKPMLDCFQSKFGTYPFAEDGYKLVETPYLGMEHQSAIAYGNMYLKGYLGKDRSQTGIGLNFDYIIVHESGHEWFGNSITAKDIADMWLHESFTTYSEAVYVECQYGYDQGQIYINGLKNIVKNVGPSIGTYGVYNEGSGDMYSKGALMLNTIRHLVNDDEKWWKMLFLYNEKFHHQIIEGQTAINFFNTETGIDLSKVFQQYLRYGTLPRLEYRINNDQLEYHWIAMVEDFDMPIDIKIKDEKIRIRPTTQWTTSKYTIKSLDEVEVLTNDFFVNVN